MTIQSNNNWGGARAGAGRKPASPDVKRGKHGIYCTDAELLQVRSYLQGLRSQARVLQVAYNVGNIAEINDYIGWRAAEHIARIDREGGQYCCYIPADDIASYSIADGVLAMHYTDGSYGELSGFCRVNYTAGADR